MSTGERTVGGGCLASAEKSWLIDAERSDANNDWEAMKALSGTKVFGLDGGTKVYMRGIEDEYALVHVESGKFIGSDLWIPSVEVAYSKEEVKDGTFERANGVSRDKNR